MTSTFRLAVLAIAGTLVLSACGQGQEEQAVVAKNESAESVANKVAASNVRPNPGRWESRMTIEKMEMPGLPPEAQKMMKQHMGATQTFATCLTPEEAAKPDADFFQKDASDCNYERFAMADGKIDAKMTCSANGQVQNMTMNGTYSQESYNIRVSADGEAQAGMPMSMAMTIESQRVGDCNGSEQG
ncbi:hypothetical protein GCM10011371_09310 [Novosphingobium marinum]|uniref:DUF3617 domain-containing protein n=1 Tax=Novosphingobium marinum TaxID=1514948 RepID=A0A7Y9XV13_9SPHN|nr:DUF3617 domain-containing protein [Novosphingobium marinum]NYH95037.1 hypothetical protein [Novosphingobium marinum]GGC23779.1 hypothetical protein GCM10011371_09310 [Novosphingobium marinum]